MNALNARATSLDLGGLDRGFSLLETLVAMGIALVVAGGMASVYGVSTNANEVNAINVQLINSTRAKIEQIQSIPYEQVGTIDEGSATGAAYFVVDPIYEPEYDAAKGDAELSDTVLLRNGILVTRTVTVTAVDDPADGVDGDDWDGVKDPNTGTILDYKILTVTTTAPHRQLVLRQSMSTVLQGNLAVEIEGATGKDSDGSKPPKVKEVKDEVPPPGPPPPEGCEIVDPKKAKKAGKKGASEQSSC